MARGGRSRGMEVPESLSQKGFSGGELGPQLLGRSDVAKYSTGLALLRNFQVERHGGIENRAGTLYCGNAQNQSAPCRLRTFNYNSYNAYGLEVQAGLMRLWANGAPLSASGCTAFTTGTYIQQGQICSYGGAYYYATQEQYQGAPITLTISGTYTAGSQLVVTASAACFTSDMAYTGAVIKFQVPGGQIVTLTLNHYTSTTVVGGTADIAIPSYLQATPTLYWLVKAQQFNVLSDQSGVEQVITITISGGSYTPGSTLTLTANYPFFSNEMVTNATVMTFPSALGPIAVTITAYSSGTSASGKATVAIPTALQSAATNVWSIPQTVAYNEFCPQGPNLNAAWPAATPTVTLTTATNFNAGSIITMTASASVFTAGQAAARQVFVFHDGLGNTAQVLAATYISGTVMTATTVGSPPVTLQNVATANWSTPNFIPAAGPYWYAMTSTVVEIPTQMPQGALAALVTSQYNNTMTFTHQLFAPFQVTRTNQWQWSLTNVHNTVPMAPVPLSALIGFASTLHLFVYYVTSIDALGQESLASNPIICLGNYPSDGQGSNGPPNTISWAAVPGAVSYNVYGTAGAGQSTTVPGLLGSSNTLSFQDVGNDPNIATQPPAVIPQFQTTSDYPAVTSFFQQRLCFANTANHPQRTIMSQTSNYLNFTIITPTAANGAIEFDLTGTQIQPISAIVDIGKMVLHTASGEYICSGDVSGAITPTAINPIRQGSAGGALIQPVVIGVTDLFIQARGNQVRDLIYTIQSVSYSGKDLTIFSPELFRTNTVVDMCWQQIRDSIVWCLMSDGQLYGLTYIREHEIWGWHHHDTGGSYPMTQNASAPGIPASGSFNAGSTTPVNFDVIEAITVVPENQNDTLYLAIHRTINGQSYRYIERMAPREFQDLVALSDACFQDCATIFDNRNTNTSNTVTLTGSPWTPTTLITVTANTSIFSTFTVGEAVVLQQYSASGVLLAEVTILVNTYISGTQVQGYPDQTVPVWAQSPVTTYGIATKSFSLPQLPSTSLAVLADGYVVGSPNNPSYTPIVSSGGGTFTLPFNALVVCAGLPIAAQWQSLPLENYQGDSLLNKQQLVNEVTPIQFYARGGFWGQDFNHLYEWTKGASATLSTPPPLNSGPILEGIQGTWKPTGSACFMQADPLPWGCSALVTSGFSGR